MHLYGSLVVGNAGARKPEGSHTQTVYIAGVVRNKTMNDVKYYVERSTCRTSCGLVVQRSLVLKR